MRFLVELLLSLVRSVLDFCRPLRLLFLGLCLGDLWASAWMSSELVSDLWQSDSSGMLEPTGGPPEALRVLLPCLAGRLGGLEEALSCLSCPAPAWCRDRVLRNLSRLS